MSHKAKILKLMQPGVELTADEIAGALDLPVLSVRPRVCELYSSKKLRPVDTRKNRRGNNMIVWRRAG